MGKLSKLVKNLRISEEGREEIDDELTWTLVDARVKFNNAGDAFVIICIHDKELYRVRLDASASIFETTLGESTFVIATSVTLLHLSAPTHTDTMEWIRTLRDIVAAATFSSEGSLFKETLARCVSNMDYSIVISDSRPLDMSFVQAGEWAILDKINRVNTTARVGSAVVAINGVSCRMNTYQSTIKAIEELQAPFSLTFRCAPEMRGELSKYIPAPSHQRGGSAVWKTTFCHLDQGIFTCSENAETLIFKLNACSITLLPFLSSSKLGSFSITCGDVTTLISAPTVPDMFGWACALYLGIAIAHGGGFMGAMEKALFYASKERRGPNDGAFNKYLTPLAAEYFEDDDDDEHFIDVVKVKDIRLLNNHAAEDDLLKCSTEESRDSMTDGLTVEEEGEMQRRARCNGGAFIEFCASLFTRKK